uniref:Plac8 onzin related protein 2 n=1 Tax=Sander lucioperca TaxID=283035 RepID=A0A8D0D648_SANLU
MLGNICSAVPLMALCCFAFWCCPCFACRTTKQFGQCLCLPLLDVFGCIRPITMSMRVSVRQHYGIKGSLCSDCLCSTFCVPCVWCQMAREMKERQLPTTLGKTRRRNANTCGFLLQCGACSV